MSEGIRGAEPLVVPAPSFDAADAARIAERTFGKRGTASELGGERDQNFRVDAGDDSFVLKISNPADDAAVLDLQTRALEHVRGSDPDLPVMRTVPTVDGEPWASVEDGDATHLVRMFTHVPGRSASPRELDRGALRHYGEVVARMGRALRGFFHPDARYEILWDLRNAPRLRPLLDAVDDEGRRALAERTIGRFEERVEPAFGGLRAQVIHNDLTLNNVLLDDDDRVSGIVDFGDLTHTALVCDLVMALASAMVPSDDPFGTARAVIRGYASVTPLEDEEARLLGDLVSARLVSWGVIAAWLSDRCPDDADHTTAGVDEGWELLAALEEAGPDVVARRLRTAALAPTAPYDRTGTSDLLSRRRRVLGSAPLFYDEPVHFVAGEGVWLFDPSGERYLDAYNNVQVVGHGDPDVADAIEGQVRTLTTHSRYLHEAAVALGERLAGTLPDGLERVVLVNSGSEANDLAMRLAEAATGRTGAVVSEHAYHGITDATAALSPEVWPDGHRPSHVETVPPPAGASSGRGVPPEGASAAMAGAVEALESRGPGTAAFVFDSTFTSDGILPPDPAGLEAMADRVREAGGLVVADEVQSGHGRSGSDLWGFQAADVVPDVVTMGKPMGNGHPVAAVVTRPEVASALRDRTGMFSTFGGNPVSATAALAVLDAIEDRDLLARAREVGGYLGEGLERLAAEHDLVGEVRRRGLMVGVELVRDGSGTPAPEATADVVDGLRRRRVLIGSTGPDGNVLKIRPPLVFGRDHADRLLGALDGTLADVA